MDKKATGFASPTQGYEEQNIDLHRLLIRNFPATYFGRLDTGDMENLGLPRGSLLIIDRCWRLVVFSNFLCYNVDYNTNSNNGKFTIIRNNRGGENG